MNDVSVYAEYLIELQDLEKIVPQKMQLFKDKAEEVLVIIKLTDNEGSKFTMKEIFEYCARDDIEGAMIYNLLDDETWDLVEDKLSEMYNALTYVFRAFKEKTGVGVNIEMNYETDEHYFYLVQDDVVELTPQAKKLQEMGIKIELERWTETY